MRTLYIALLAFAFAGFAAAAEKAIPNRIGDIKQGEWVMMEDVSADADGEKTKITVTNVSDGKVTLRREHFDKAGTVTETKENEIDVERLRQRIADLEKKAGAMTEEFVVVGEKQIPVVAVYWEGEDKDEEGKPHEYKIWMSEKLPVTGLAKFWSSDNGIPHAEIIDYGFGNN